MKTFVENEKSRAICEKDGLVTTTFKYRNVPLSSGKGVVKNILVSVCDKCNEVVAIPPQSTPAIKAERKRANTSIEVSIPAQFVEKLDIACLRILERAKIRSNSAQQFRKPLLMWYVHTSLNNNVRKQAIISAISGHTKSGRNKSEPKRRISFKCHLHSADQLTTLEAQCSGTRTDVVMSLIQQIDSEVSKHPKVKHLNELAALAAASCS